MRSNTVRVFLLGLLLLAFAGIAMAQDPTPEGVARLADMDLNGIWASVNFPSQITGFCGSVFSRCSDPELGLAVTRAWNDWFFDEWYGTKPAFLQALDSARRSLTLAHECVHHKSW